MFVINEQVVGLVPGSGSGSCAMKGIFQDCGMSMSVVNFVVTAIEGST